MEIISTGAADILLVEVPDDAHSFEIQDNPVGYGKHVMMLRGIPDYDCVYSPVLPEDYNYTILGRASDIDENKAKDLMPLVKRVYGASYYDYMSPDKNNSFYYAMDALQSFKSFLESQGIFLENPYSPPIERLQYGGGYAMRQAEIEEYEEAQSKVKIPLVIKAEKV